MSSGVRRVARKLLPDNLFAERLDLVRAGRGCQPHLTLYVFQSMLSNSNPGPLPLYNAHTDTAHRVVFEVFDPAFDDLGVRVPSLDRALVDFALKVFLRLLVGKWTFEDCPQRALCR